MAIDPTTPFVWGAGGAPMTPQAAEAQRKVAQALLAQGMDYSPIKSPWQGAARVAQALVGGYESAQADASDRKLAEMQPQMLAAALTGTGLSGGTPSVAAPMGAASIPSGEIDPSLKTAISTAASANPGVDPAYMTRLALVENGGRINGGSPLSSAQGPFQFLSGTARQYNLSNPNDPAASADAAARLTLDNKAALTSALGREPTPGELYLAHQQGPTGAIKLLQNPDAPVESVIGAQAARNNAATPGMTAGQFANKWIGKFGDLVQTVDPTQKNIIDAQADSPPMAFAGTQPTTDAPAAVAAPVAAAVPQAAQQPSGIAKIAPLISLANSPYAGDATKKIAGVLLASQLAAIQKASDPMTALDKQQKELAIKKAQQDLNSQGKFQVIGEDPMGRKQYGFVDGTSATVTPYTPQGDSSSNMGGFGDMSKSGADYLATVPKAQALTMQGMIDGTVQPPSSFALAKPYWQNMLAGAKNIDPNFDANTWATRHKMSVDLAASGNSSMGGIISNGKSAFSHLSDLSKSMADLGNASHDFPGGGIVAKAQNFLGNSAFSSSANNAKIKAITDNLGHYGQESTKFYSGTGGGVEERMNALKEMNPVTTSSEEMAAYLAKEKSLMTERLREKEAQIRDTMGEGYLARHPVFTPRLQQTMETIDANIAKLNGLSPTSTSSAAPSASGQRKTSTGVSWSIQ